MLLKFIVNMRYLFRTVASFDVDSSQDIHSAVRFDEILLFLLLRSFISPSNGSTYSINLTNYKINTKKLMMILLLFYYYLFHDKFTAEAAREI